VISQLAPLVLAVASFLAISAGAARAQQTPTPTDPAPAPSSAPAAAQPAAREAALLKVQVVISRYQGEKKISSQPFTLSVTANGPRASLRMGTQVPILSSPVVTGPDGKTPPSAYNYKNVGTSIECAARALDDGRYRLELTIDDSSVASDDQGPQPFAKGPPQFRSFQISGQTVLRDGQSTQLTTAAEKVTGEIARIDVTLSVIK